MLARNIRVEEDLIDQLFNSSEKRLARTLLLLARYGSAGRSSKDASQSIARDAGGDDWHNAVPSQFFHEQIQETGLHPIQRRDPRQQFPPECCPARLMVVAAAIIAAWPVSLLSGGVPFSARDHGCVTSSIFKTKRNRERSGKEQGIEFSVNQVLWCLPRSIP